MAKKVIVILAFVLMFIFSKVYAQNSNNFISIISNTSLNWNINTQSEIENDQTISGAITIRVKNRSSPAYRSVYVRCSSITAPSGFALPYIPLKLDYTSDNSPYETNLITTPITITTTDQRLFTHTRQSTSSTYSFNYNLIHTATNWEFPPGTYNYTLTFTFVNP